MGYMRLTAPFSRTRDRGYTLAEILVAMVISTVVIAVGVSLLASTFRVSAQTQTRAELWGQMSNTSVSLIRDVNDSTRVVTAEPERLAIQVVRDGRCVQREWAVDGDRLLSKTTFYDAATCTGGSTEDLDGEVIQGGLTGMTFSYFSQASLSSALPTPVDASQVSRIGWVITGTPRPSTAVLRLESSASVMGRGTATDGGGAEQDAVAADLSIVTHETAVPGVHAPVLRWTDRSPELSQGWSVYRTSYPDGADAASSGWEQVAYLATSTPAPGTMTWTDTSLPKGHTALYVVRATTSEGYGPSSNQVASGLRPVAPTLTTTGSQGSISLTWTASVVGATGYDVYRSEGGTAESAPVLYKRWSEIKSSATRTGTGAAARWTWTDSLTPGQARTYSLVAVNRWERVATTTTQMGELPTGEALAKQYSGTTQTSRTAARAASTTSGAFTAPAQPNGPVLALSSATSATDYSSRVTWAPATWTGGGPVTATDGQGHRDRGWTSQRRTTGGYTAVWTTEVPRGTATKVDFSTAPDMTYGYQIRTVNGAGASVWSAEKRILQRPAVPAAPAVALTGLTTRQATVTAATSPSATSWAVEMTTGAGSSAMRGVRATASDRRLHYNELAHSSDHVFRTRSTNVAPVGTAGGGTSAWGATGSVRTDPLRVSIVDGWSDTRRIDLTLGTTGGAGGDSARIEVTRSGAAPGEGIGTKAGPGRHRWDPLQHGTGYQAWASNTDGYNSVAVGPVSVATQELRVWLSDGGSTTKTVSARLHNQGGDTASLTAASPDRVEGQPSVGGGQQHVFDRIRHASTVTLTARVSDGWNAVAYQDTIETQRLGVSTPSCYASRSGQYAPATVYFSSSGSLNRTSVYAGSPGYYSALATNTNSDGYNYVSASNDCGISVEALPLVNGGATGGTPSAVCTPYQNVAAGLFRQAAGPPAGTEFGELVQAYGSLRGGSIAQGNLACDFFRQYKYYNSETGVYRGLWGQVVLWYQNGSGGV